jgi:hypothetical protein
LVAAHLARPASTQKILELRDQGLIWNEVAKQFDLTGHRATGSHRNPASSSSRRCVGLQR